jgi:protein subunit release factor A
MEKKIDGQHDSRIFQYSAAIFSEKDLRELINTIYSQYKYKGAQCEKLTQMISFMDTEDNKFSRPEIASQCSRLVAYLDTFREFLKANFQPGEENFDGDTIYEFQPQSTSYENEAFLTEFQMMSMDVEKAYKSYLAEINSYLKL